MDFPSLATLPIALLVAALLASTLSRIFSSIKDQKNLPPGPKPWPVIGNLNLLAGSVPHQTLHQLSQKYGHLMHLKLGSRPVIVASSAEMAKQFLKTYDHIFASRPATAAGKYIAYNYKDVIITPQGAYWKSGRKLYLNHVFSSKCLQQSENIRVEERRALVSRLHSLSGKNILFKEHISRVSLSIICRIVLGMTYFSTDSEKKINEVVALQELVEMIHEFFALITMQNLADWIPWTCFLDLQGYFKRMKSLSKKFNHFFDHVINDHRQRREIEKDDFVAKDFIDNLLLQLDNNDDRTSSTHEVKLTADGVKGLAQDLIVGGTETTATTLVWGMSELIKHPEIMKKATEELDRVVGRERWVEESDLPQLPYLEAIVKETMRLHPTTLSPHFALEDCSVDGYDIRKGTTLFVNIWSIGRDPSLWDEPEKFWPERFIGKDTKIDVKGYSFELLPFGSGRRMCPGYNLALKVFTSIIGDLLHGFNWKLPDNMKTEELSMEEIYNLSNDRKFPLVASTESRLPHHLY